ncbi:MAG: TsaE protein required for threonylcarbamoyladenosine t(6)A37 formation in tRNA [Planctomycetaceae bacterium]|nr:TsaE protein required for threonylcarbamoyladenosine t(6)A37 formation in tRNA [Planctomycetaceae bacterium]
MDSTSAEANALSGGDSDSDGRWVNRTDSVDQTLKLGQILGQLVTPGTVLALSGNLGAGKTHFTQGIAMGLGIERKLVNSPTFALIQEYSGRLPVFHFDTYRLRSVDEFLELGFDEYLAAQGVCIIEWGDRVIEVLPADRLTIRISVESDCLRRFDWQSGGVSSGHTLAKLKAAWAE